MLEPSACSFVLAQGSADKGLEVGIQGWHTGRHPFLSQQHTVCYFLCGAGVFWSEGEGETKVEAGTLVHFKSGWRGRLEVSERLEASYMTCPGAAGSSTARLQNVVSVVSLNDWGTIPTMLQGESRTAGILLSRDPDRRAESGIWTCTPGKWRCEVSSDEYCHFVEGAAVYLHESGEHIEILPDTLALFPKGWKGVCEVRETVRKVYLIR